MWKIVKLEEVCKKITDGSHFSPKTVEDGIPYITVRDITEKGIDFDNCKFISNQSFYELKKNGCSPTLGDVLFSKDGTVGKVAEVKSEVEFSVLSSLAILTPDNSLVMSSFLAYILKSPVFLKEAIRSKTGVAIRRIILKNLKKIEFSLPPLSEQQRIVTKLDAAFAEIDKMILLNQKRIDNSQLFIEKYLSSVKADKRQIGDLTNIKTGKLDANAMTEDGEFPFFTCSREIFKIDNYAFDCEAVLLAGNNASGDFNVKHYIGKFNAYQRTYVITVKEQESLKSRYLYFQLINSLKIFKKMSVGTGTRFLKLGMIKEFKIPLPSIEEQDQILIQLEKINNETKNIDNSYKFIVKNLQSLKSAILFNELQCEVA